MTDKTIQAHRATIKRLKADKTNNWSLLTEAIQQAIEAEENRREEKEVLKELYSLTN